MEHQQLVVIICNNSKKRNKLAEIIRTQYSLGLEDKYAVSKINDFEKLFDNFNLFKHGFFKKIDNDKQNEIKQMIAVLIDLENVCVNEMEAIKNKFLDVKSIDIPLLAIYSKTKKRSQNQKNELNRLLEIADDFWDGNNENLLIKKVERCQEISKLKNEKDAFKKNKKAQANVIEVIVNLIERRHDETGNHIKNTRALAEKMARIIHESDARGEELRKELYTTFGINDNTTPYDKLEMIETGIENIGFAAMLHDIGKIEIPDAILCKKEKPTDEEFEEICKHANNGYEFIKKNIFLSDENIFKYSQDMARFHHVYIEPHERSYPFNCSDPKSEYTARIVNIPITARIMSLIDAYDTMKHPRSYAIPKTSQNIKADIMGYGFGGKQFDKDLADIFIENWEDFEKLMEDCSKDDKKLLAS